jgi:hypothetical protein
MSSAADMQKKNPKIHFYTLHAGDHPGDFYTNVTGLVTCKTCLRLLKGSRRTPRALDGGESPANLSLFSAEVIRPAKVTRKSPRH